MCATNHCDCADIRLAPDKPFVKPPQPKSAELVRQPPSKSADSAEPPQPKSAENVSRHPSHIPKFSISSSDSGKAIQNGFSRLRNITSHPKVRTILASSQPVHALAIICVSMVLACLVGEPNSSPKPYSSLTTFAYISSFALRLGSQYWMTFVSGLSLYFTLTRHAFGDVQVVLFPIYFASNAVLSAIGLLSFTKLHGHMQWETSHWIQVIALSTSFLLESLGRLYVAPRVVELIKQKKAIELSQPGVGSEIGKHDPGPLKDCPHYMALHGRFRRQHTVMAICNVTAIACTILQLFYACQSFCFTPC